MKFLLHALFFLGLGFSLIYCYLNYWDDIYFAVFGEQLEYNIFIESLGVTVTLADDPEERRQGLSGTTQLDELEGKLFLFDTAARHGIWMKDMNYAIDIMWINEDFEIVHIEENIAPDTFPDVFGPDEPARYVLEMKALTVATYKIEEGDRLTLPPGLIPSDLAEERIEEFAN